MAYGLYIVTDRVIGRGMTHADMAALAVAGGADVVQLRDKDMPAADLTAEAVNIREITEDSGTLFIVNDRIDIALASGADGVHLGQSDIPAEYARKIVPDDFIIGISVSTPDEALKARNSGADYVSPGPVFTTATKSDAGDALGLDTVFTISAAVEIPVVPIGGISGKNAASVIGAGADGVAVISAVFGREDAVSAAADLKKIIEGAKTA
ncbi:thiamine phosphate synthase [Methanoplanus limicola]|uniref:Thiamine-phosphate synthase n=1 Tax=Methanoplanus limicola DSM 2279 TaxID=937775 RepID=H1Z1T9_9EURY|nr:thiamine phosphate synthase [Methanoplanus limicola]EHQ35406.1 thiamine-phosphate diphosphorylase [Methanoplanus limicola DSM 2279]